MFFKVILALLLLSLPLSALPHAALNQSLEEHIKYNPQGPNYVGHILIGKDSSISQSTWLYVKKALEEYKKLKPIFIILELNTPGGEVFAAQKISDALKDCDILDGIPVVAVINNWAISAGAMLAYSCRYIAVVKDASMGAAEPLTQTAGGATEVASEKINSAIRKDFAGRAGFFDRNGLIAEAMVDPDTILVLREGKIVRLFHSDQIKESDEILNPKGKLLTLSAQEMLRLGVADFLLEPVRLPPITKEEQQAGRWPASKELLFQIPFFKAIPHAEIVAYQPDWKDKFFAFISLPLVSSLLFLGLMVSFYIELNTPGFGLAGTVALLCLFLIVLASFAQAAAPWLELIILLGAGLILLELFVIPGFGVPGIVGVLLALFGLSALLLPSVKDIHYEKATKTFNAAGYYFLERLGWLAGTFIVGCVVIALLTRYVMPHFFLLKRLVLKGEQEAKLGFTAASDQLKLPKLGEVGSVVAPLRPAGKISIHGEIYDAMSRGNFIDLGEQVSIIAIAGNKIIVERLIL